MLINVAFWSVDAFCDFIPVESRSICALLPVFHWVALLQTVNEWQIFGLVPSVGEDGAGFNEIAFALLWAVLTIVNPFPGFGVVELVSVAVGQQVHCQVFLELLVNGPELRLDEVTASWTQGLVGKRQVDWFCCPRNSQTRLKSAQLRSLVPIVALIDDAASLRSLQVGAPQLGRQIAIRGNESYSD